MKLKLNRITPHKRNFQSFLIGIVIFAVCCQKSDIAEPEKADPPKEEVNPYYKFTIPVLPDTQEAVTARNNMLFSQMRWIANKKDSLKAPIVLHVGDVVNFDTITHWQVASTGYKYLDDKKLPYAIALGNHDTRAVAWNSGSAADPTNTNARLRMTEKFNTYFPVSRFSLQKGRYEEGRSDNSYYMFQAGGLNWMVVTLEFCAREGAAQWMDKVIKEHPEHNVIIVTHVHLRPDGQIHTTNSGYGDMKVIDIFNQYIKPHKNVLLVLSGHNCYSAYRVNEGIQGNKIHQILTDYQCEDYGGGYICLLDIDAKNKMITAKMHSPYYNKTLQDKGNFVIRDVEFIYN